MPLTDVKIRQAKPTEKTQKLTDGNGLYLEVKPNGVKAWRYRYKIAGKENVYAIGDYPSMSLQDARKAREDARELVKKGVHPSHARQQMLAGQLDQNATTFEYIAREWLSKKAAQWTPEYHQKGVRRMEMYVFPKIGRLPIRSVTAAQLLEIFQLIAEEGQVVTAQKARQFCSAIFCYAVATLRADYDPAAPLQRTLMRPPVEHATAHSVAQLRDFLDALDQYQGQTTRIAIKLLMYMFVRTVELRRAEWSEINFDDAVWVVPPQKMKRRRTHMVPLSRQSLALLSELKTITGHGKLLFPNIRDVNKPMSASTINRALENMHLPMSGHDFRATASTHLYEMGYRSELVEMQLAHAEKNQTRAAYNHAQYLAERRVMMQAWADWIDGLRK